MTEIVSGWHYDKILSQKQEEFEKVDVKQQEFKTELRKKLGDWRYVLKEDIQLGWTKEQIEEKIRDIKRSLGENYIEFYEWNKEKIRNSHPILLGPATLDSLLEEEPDRLDYIQKGNFPFDNVFFEFMEPVQSILPTYGIEGSFCGLNLKKNDYEGVMSDSYLISAFYKMQNNKYASLEFNVFNDARTLVDGQLSFPLNDKVNEKTTLIRNINDEGIFEGFIYEKSEENFDLFPNVLFTITEREFNEEEVEQQFSKLNNLSINIINYINAQNVTLIPGKRKVQTRRFRGSRRSGREIIHEAEKPYHIIGIDTKTINLEEEREEDRSLQWRVYVRGHNRRYRDKLGRIKEVIWIAPYVRGPEEAPWRHHRYAVMAGMLEREKKMLGDYHDKRNLDSVAS